MNKEKVKEHYQALVTALDELPHNVVLSAGAALVMMGIRENTNDLDADVPTAAFKNEARKNGIVEEENVNPRVKYTDHIELHELSEYTGRVCIEGVYVYSPHALLQQKRHLAHIPNRPPIKREQDLMEIVQLESLVRSPRHTARMA